MMMLRSLFLIIIAIVAVIATTMALFIHANPVPIHQHSLEPPLLVNYEESGMPFWTFGANTVVANDYVRLTPKIGPGRGYLWNKHPAMMTGGAINFTIRSADKSRFHLFGSGDTCKTCGAAFWHVADANRHGQANFFGIPNKFRGIGIVFPISGNMHIVASDGEQFIDGVEQITIAQCAFSLDDTPRIIMINFQYGMLSVAYAPADRPTYTVPCVSNVQPQFVEQRYYFGFTSYHDNINSVGTDIMAMSATGSLDSKDDLNAKENFVYDAEEERQHKLLFDGKPDEPQTEDQKKEAAKKAAAGGAQ